MVSWCLCFINFRSYLTMYPLRYLALLCISLLLVSCNKDHGHTYGFSSKKSVDRACFFVKKRWGRRVIIVLSAPSGTGKSSVMKEFVKKDKRVSIVPSVTTRKPRWTEKDGLDYFFVSDSEYDRMMQNNEFIEHATVFQNRYALSARKINDVIGSGRDAIIDLDWQGVEILRKNIKNAHIITIYMLPPSIEELNRRLSGRGTDSHEVIEHRMSKALDEISHYKEYDYVLTLNSIHDTSNAIEDIYNAHKIKIKTCYDAPHDVNRLMHEIKTTKKK